MSAIAIHRNITLRLSTLAGIAIALTLGIAGTGTAQPAAATSIAAQAPQPVVAKQKPHHRWYQFGRASWYGKYFQGHATASGESYNMYDMTCAHRSLPIGSLIRVTNLRNHKTVVVRVNDRGPVPENRIVDLSYAAASFLGFNGVAPVRLELLPATTMAQLHIPGE